MPNSHEIQRQALWGFYCLEPDGLVSVVELKPMLDLLEAWWYAPNDGSIHDEIYAFLHEHGRPKDA